MVAFRKEDLERWSGGSWQGGAPRSNICGFAIDSRQLREGEVFVAIETEKRDGHAFLAMAAERGAAGAITNRYLEDLSLPQLVVEDTELAFQTIAARYRETCDGTVIGITGSCGKTTVKDLVSLLLGGVGTVLKTEGNLNNLLGVPLTLLQPEARDSVFLVIEAGISEPGEMSRLRSMIQPDLAVFTAIGPAHLEDLGSEETVAREKALLFDASRTRRSFLGESCMPYVEFFGTPATVARRAVELSQDGQYKARFEAGKTKLRLRVEGAVEQYEYAAVGAGMASNVALAILVARSLGAEANVVAERLGRWESGAMRGQWLRWSGGHVFLDCYNANPLSMADALETFCVMSEGEPRLYVIGCMEELGEASRFFHRKLGASLPLSEASRAVVIGEGARWVREGAEEAGKSGFVRECASLREAEAAIEGFEGDLFVKGSRRYRLERVMELLGQTSDTGENRTC